MTANGLHPAADVRRWIRAGLLTILFTFGGFGTWAAVAPLSGAVIAPGFVKIDTNRKTVQHLEGGIIKEILVRDGDSVRAGQPLVVLEDRRVDASLNLIQGQLDAVLARTARLEAERAGLDRIEFPARLLERVGSGDLDSLVQRETTLFDSKRGALEARIGLFEQEIAHARDQVAALKQQIDSERSAAEYLQQEINANEELERKQLVPRTQLLNLKRNLQEYEARSGEHRAEIAAAEQNITQLQLRIIDERNRYVQDAADQLTKETAQLHDLEDRLRPALDATERKQVTAPIAGIVVNLRVFTVGGIIGPREAILDIVPEDNPLLVEAQVDVGDIDDLSIGQAADIRLTAYRARSTPLLEGKVIYVSADRLVDERNGFPYYTCHIELFPDSLRAAPDLQLYPGMPAEVYIRTQSRTLLDYLLAPVEQTMRRSFRES
jgi:HlyD family type I secretion membrane fusion protein